MAWCPIVKRTRFGIELQPVWGKRERLSMLVFVLACILTAWVSASSP